MENVKEKTDETKSGKRWENLGYHDKNLTGIKNCPSLSKAEGRVGRLGDQLSQ